MNALTDAKTVLHPQLADIAAQLDAASDEARSLTDNLDARQLAFRPQPDKWSIAECFVHLNLSARAELEVLDATLAVTPKGESSSVAIYKMDWLGKLLKWTLEPPPMFWSKIKTTPDFQPAEDKDVSRALPDFFELQEQLKERVKQMNCLPLDRITIVSPFNRRVKYNLLSFFHILLAHERRHLWQARQNLNQGV